MTRSLDLSCGGPLHNPFLADEVVGVSLHAQGRWNVVEADLVVEPIPFADASFDHVTAYSFLQTVPQLVYAPNRRNAFIELMNEVARVLKPGGSFLSATPLYPHALVMRDPAQVNVITEETFPLYFAEPHHWAKIYGFVGQFGLVQQEVRGQQLLVMLQKLPVAATVAAPGAPKVSVFIPVYNAGDYLARTLDAVLAQSFAAFEVVCVDDGSTDASFDVLQQYAARDARVRVFKTPQNLGAVPRVINWTLDQPGALRGDYFVYSSQDDLFSRDWLQKMHARAVETGADAVVPDLVFFHEHEPQKNRAVIGLRGDRSPVISGREAAQLSLDWTIPGNALWRMELVRRVKFHDFASNADEYTGRVLYLNCAKVAFSEGQFLYRQDNERAITKAVTFKTFDMPYTFCRLYELFKEHGFPPEVYEVEAMKAQRALASLKAWLQANGAAWPEAHQHEARQRIARAEQCLAQIGHAAEPVPA